jgi:hypothetical protein
MEGINQMETEFVAEAVLTQARETLERVLTLTPEAEVCEKLELGYGEANPLYVASKSESLAMTISSLRHLGTQYFLGYMHE